MPLGRSVRKRQQSVVPPLASLHDLFRAALKSYLTAESNHTASKPPADVLTFLRAIQVATPADSEHWLQEERELLSNSSYRRFVGLIANYRLGNYDALETYTEWRKLFSPRSVSRSYWYQVLGPSAEDLVNSAVLATEELSIALPPQAFSKISKFRLIGEGIDRLTPKLMADAVMPYLLAVADLQRIIDEMNGHATTDVTIKLIKQGSISVNLGGADGAIAAIKNLVIPWRRTHQAEMARLEEQKAQAEIEATKATALETRARAEKERQEAKLTMAEAAKVLAETEKIHQDTQLERVRVALEIIKQMAPNMTEEQKFAYVAQLMEPLKVIADSSLEIASGNKK